MRPLKLPDVKKFISESSIQSEVMIGCDSMKYRDSRTGQRMARFARVVVIHIDGKHGCAVFGEIVREPDYGSLKGRLMREVQIATDLACELLDVIGDRQLQLHLDINLKSSCSSHIAVKEATGYVLGMLGFEPNFKPNSLAASYCADRLMR